MLVLISFALASDSAPPPIVNGSTTQDYPQVVTLYSQDSRGYGYNFCSGTLIHKSWVVTAGHCADAFASNEADYGYDDHIVVVGYDLNKSAGIQDTARVKSWTTHPNWDGENNYYDIAMVELKTAITSIDPMPVNKTTLRASDVGEDYRYVGWGITSDNATDSTKKRTADLPLYEYDNFLHYAYDPVDDQNVCSGDSGGAGLEILGDGMFELQVVNSFVFAIKGGNTPCATGATGGPRIDVYVHWIETFTDVYSWEEMYGGTDTGTEDTGSGDADTDTDTDADADADADTDTDTDTDNGGSEAPFEDPATPGDVGEDYQTTGLSLCGTPAPTGALLGFAGLVLAAGRRRRGARLS